MFGDYLRFDSVSEKQAKIIANKLTNKDLLNKTIISIGGISGTRKSETAFKLAERLIGLGKECHIISGDDYYKIPWHRRDSIRKKNLDIVGPEEYDWNRLNWTFETYHNPMYEELKFFLMSKFSTGLMECSIPKKNFDILIFEGLYACDSRIEADIKVHLGNTNPNSTFDFRHKRKKENEDSDLRKAIVKRECDAVAEISKNANFMVGVK